MFLKNINIHAVFANVVTKYILKALQHMHFCSGINMFDFFIPIMYYHRLVALRLCVNKNNL